MPNYLIQPKTDYDVDPNDVTNAVLALSPSGPVTGLMNGTSYVAREFVLSPPSAEFTPSGDVAAAGLAGGTGSAAGEGATDSAAVGSAAGTAVASGAGAVAGGGGGFTPTWIQANGGYLSAPAPADSDAITVFAQYRMSASSREALFSFQSDTGNCIMADRNGSGDVLPSATIWNTVDGSPLSLGALEVSIVEPVANDVINVGFSIKLTDGSPDGDYRAVVWDTTNGLQLLAVSGGLSWTGANLLNLDGYLPWHLFTTADNQDRTFENQFSRIAVISGVAVDWSLQAQRDLFFNATTGELVDPSISLGAVGGNSLGEIHTIQQANALAPNGSLTWTKTGPDFTAV